MKIVNKVVLVYLLLFIFTAIILLTTHKNNRNSSSKTNQLLSTNTEHMSEEVKKDLNKTQSTLLISENGIKNLVKLEY